MLNLRIRSKQGVDNIKVDQNQSFIEFQTLLKQKTNITPENQKILCGFPPKILDIPNGSEVKLSTILTSGDTITIEDKSSTSTTTTSTTSPPISIPTNPTFKVNNSNTNSLIAPTPTPSPSSFKPSPNSIVQPTPPKKTSLPDEDIDGYVQRRKTEDDNSCLFSAVAYVLEDKNRKAGMKLRNVIADAVGKDPFQYNEGVLGKSNQEYCSWITNPKNWGGAIELSILSNHYRIEIAAFDIITKIMYCYGEDQNYKQRAYLIYDGIHYDALSLCLVKDGPEDFDVTQFPSSSQSTADKMKGFVEQEHKAGKYTDTSNFTLLCLDCNKTLKGEKEAALHATQTKHSNFTEYRKK